MPAGVADPPRWEGLATLSALSIATGRRRIYRGYLKAPKTFPVSISLQKFCKGEGEKKNTISKEGTLGN